MTEGDGMPQRGGILVIDDDPQFLQLIAERLKAGRWEVVTALDGPSGFQKALSGKPDLILLDLVMPGEDGFQVMARLKEDARTRGIPVVVVTAKGEFQSVLRAQKLGAVDYMVKPFGSEELVKLIDRYTQGG